MTIPRPTWTRAAVWHFVRHYLEMVVAMVLGMAVLGPVESVVLDPLGWQSVRAVSELNALVMATNMTVAMVAWMRYRGHGWRANTEMAASMVLPTFAAIVLLGVGVMTDIDTLLVVEHVAMLLGMLGAMLLRLDEYTHHHGHVAADLQPATT